MPFGSKEGVLTLNSKDVEAVKPPAPEEEEDDKDEEEAEADELLLDFWVGMD
jgi:hypothetical protein